MKEFTQGGFFEMTDESVDYDNAEENGPLLVTLILAIDILVVSAACGGILYLATQISERLSGG